MKNLFIFLLLLVGHAAANEYQDFYRADFEGRKRLAQQNDKRLVDYAIYLNYAFPESCSTLENVRGGHYKRDTVYFIPCEYNKPFFAKVAKESYHLAVVHDGDTAFFMSKASNTQNRPFYVYINEMHAASVKKMTEKGKRYSVLLFPESTPSVTVY